MSIDDFIKDIKNGNSGVLCTVLGKFCADPASNSWVYQQKDFRNTSEYEYEEGADNSQANIEENKDDEVDVEEEESFVPVGVETPVPTTKPVPATPLGVSFGGKFKSVFGLLSKRLVKGWTGSFTMYAKASSVDDEAAGDSTAAPSATATPVDDGNAQEEGTIDETAVFAYTEITDATKLSEPVYMYGSDYFRDVDNMTYMLFQNAINSSYMLQRMSDKSTR